jgi:hypothetical protein
MTGLERAAAVAAIAESTARLNREAGQAGPVGWWIDRFDSPLVARGAAKPMLYPDAAPVYLQNAIDAAYSQGLEDAAKYLESVHPTRLKKWADNIRKIQRNTR